MANQRSIMVVEDETDVRTLIRFHLEQEGFAVREAESGDEALAMVDAERPSLVVLDLMLPGTGGLEVCRRLRAAESTRLLPIVMLTARVDEVDRVLGLELGADDYLTKPFSPRELMARIRAILRRSEGVAAAGPPAPPDRFERGRLRVDFDTHEIQLEGRKIGLSVREFALLEFFLRHPGWVYSREQLLELVWGRDVHVGPRTVDAHIVRLRKRLERGRGAPEVIVTVRGVGYKFNPDALNI